MNNTPGTKGYAEVTQAFIEATLAIDFFQLHSDFVPFFPRHTGLVLDVGAGIGRDAATFAAMGHKVVAVEPTESFRTAGKKRFGALTIEWIDDSLPLLKTLSGQAFDFILVSGVWHHLEAGEQENSLLRIGELLGTNGTVGLTLRNGPAGAGTHVFPTDGQQLIQQAESYGLKTLLLKENQPSIMKNKGGVTWTKLVFQKPATI